MTPTRDTQNPGSEDAAAYALHALESARAAQLRNERSRDADLDREIAEFEAVAAELGLAAEPVQPSAGLRASILDRLDSLPQLGAEEALAAETGADSTAPRASTPAESPADTAPAAGTVTPIGAARSRRSRPVWIIAGVAAGVGLFFGGLTLGQGLLAPQAPPAAITAEARLSALLAADDLERVVTPVDGGGTATVVWSARHTGAAIAVSDLPALPADRVLELWLIDGNGATPAGTFGPESEGVTWALLEGTLAPGDTIGVTVEPRGGSQTPTTDPIVVVPT